MALNTDEINKVNDLYKELDVLKARNAELSTVADRLDRIEALLEKLVKASK